MPWKLKQRPGAPAPEEPQTQEMETPQDESGSALPAVAGAGGLALLAAILKNPQAAKEFAKKGYDVANAVRMTSMLSGLAPVKSVAGNVGAVVNMAVEDRSLKPLKELFKRQTAKDFISELRTPTTEISKATAEGARIGNPIGRVMGAADTATQRVMQRAGASPERSAAATLQTPLPPQVAEALNSRGAQWVLPFRRTPINQALEAARMLKPGYGDKALMAAHAVGGATTGAASSDERFPVMPAIYSAFAGRYAAPAVLGALAARAASGAKTSGGLVSNLLPASEYGVESSLTEPLAPLGIDLDKGEITPEGIAGVRALRRIAGKD